jgi:hypothetical protein
MTSKTNTTWIRAATIALAVGAASAYLWTHNHSHPAPSSTSPGAARSAAPAGRFAARQAAEDTNAEWERLNRGLAEMDDQIAALAAQIDTLKRQRTSASASPGPSIANPERDATARHRDAELQSGDDPAQAQEMLIQQALIGERPDPRWAPMAESSIRRMFEDEQIPSLKLVNAQCGATLCRIDVADNGSSNDGGFDQSFRKLLLRTPWRGQGFGRVYDPFGPSPTGVLFLAREGNALPQAAS